MPVSKIVVSKARMPVPKFVSDLTCALGFAESMGGVVPEDACPDDSDLLVVDQPKTSWTLRPHPLKPRLLFVCICLQVLFNHAEIFSKRQFWNDPFGHIPSVVNSNLGVDIFHEDYL